MVTKQLKRYTSSTFATATSIYPVTSFVISDFNQVSVSVQTDQTLTGKLMWGRSTDADNALPHGDSQSFTGATIAEGSGHGYIWNVPPDAEKATIKFTNSSGSTATVIIDIGLRSI